MIDLGPPPQFWLPRPAIIRPAEFWRPERDARKATFPFPIPSPKVAGGGATPILDGLSPDACWGIGRNLLTSWGASARYTTATGIDSLKDQTGGGSDFNMSSTGPQPAVGTAGANSVPSANFDGSDDTMSCAKDASFYMTVSDWLMILSVQVDSPITTDSGAPYQNQQIIGDNSGYVGLGLRDPGSSPKAEGWSFNGSNWLNPVQAGISTGVALVLSYRRTGGNIYLSVNGGTEQVAASANTASLATRLSLAHSIGSYGKIRFIEGASWKSSTARPTVVSAMMSYSGAV
jgi:hypothetical protein